ncbi:STE24 endopeptidase, partial [Phenoliferia sp. Uapishka_3]
MTSTITSGLSALQARLDTDDIPWQRTVILIGVGVAIFEGYIGHRQGPYLSSILSPTIPAALAPYLPASTSQKTYHASQAYAKAKMSYGSVMSGLDQIETALLLTGVLSPVYSALFGSNGVRGNWTLLKGFWDVSGRLLGSVGKSGEIKQSLVFVTIMTLIGTVLTTPKAYWKAFVLEEKHGFNKMTRHTFWVDQVKGVFLSLALEIPILAGILKIIHLVGRDGMLTVVAYLMLFIFSFQLVMIPLYPYLIAPLFNKFTPLEESSPVYPLVSALSTKLGFPLGRVWVMDGSKRSSHSNAYFFGLPGLTKHIVIYDTLLTQASPEEVEAILGTLRTFISASLWKILNTVSFSSAHELGHWSHFHVPILLLTSLFQTSVTLLTFTLFLSNAHLVSAFGFPSTSPPTIISLLLAANVFQPLSAILSFAMNSITRILEYDADKFAAALGSSYAVSLKKALVRIHEENLSIYGVDWIYSAYNHNHPTLCERLEALDGELEKSSSGSKGEAKKDL